MSFPKALEALETITISFTLLSNGQIFMENDKSELNQSIQQKMKLLEENINSMQKIISMMIENMELMNQFTVLLQDSVDMIQKIINMTK